MRDLVIQPAKEGKGRAFTATLVAHVRADALWDGGSTDTDTSRPVWMMLAGTDNELRPFVANLRLGRKAEALSKNYNRNPDRFEILKSSGFHTAWQRTPLGSVVTLFAPDLFRLDPGMVDPKGVNFVVLPAKKTLASVHVAPSTRAYLGTLGHEIPEDRIEDLLRTAPIFIAYLDRRTRCPLIPDPRFYVQILCAAMHAGLAGWARDPERDRYYNRYDARPFGFQSFHGFFEEGVADAHLAPGIVFRSSHDTLEQFLAEQVALYTERVKEIA